MYGKYRKNRLDKEKNVPYNLVKRFLKAMTKTVLLFERIQRAGDGESPVLSIIEGISLLSCNPKIEWLQQRSKVRVDEVPALRGNI